MILRAYQPGEAPRLREVFHASIHGLASRDYTREQLDAWAPREYDPVAWERRMARIQPWVVEQDGLPIAYADLQPDGYIDHFFVSGDHGGRGVGGRLMRHLLSLAEARGLDEVYAHVSLTAQPFFEHFGFRVETVDAVTLRGVELRNATLRRPVLSPLFREIREREIALHQPATRRDALALAQLLHPDFRECGRSGAVHSRAEMIAHLLRDPEVDPILAQDWRFEILAETLVLATYRSSQLDASGRAGRHANRSSLWQRTSEGWQLRFHQGTPCPPFLIDAPQSEPQGKP